MIKYWNVALCELKMDNDRMEDQNWSPPAPAQASTNFWLHFQLTFKLKIDQIIYFSNQM